MVMMTGAAADAAKYAPLFYSSGIFGRLILQDHSIAREVSVIKDL
jgi:hypothetical protein